MKSIILPLAIFFALSAQATTNPPIKAGVEITIEDYHRELDVFMVTINKERAVGPNFATSLDLWRSLGHEWTRADFIKKKDQLIGTVLTLKKPLPLIEGEDIVKKYKKLHPNKKARISPSPSKAN